MKPTLLLKGILPLVWNRSYYSDQDGIGWLGEGWSVPGCQRIIRDAAGLAYTDDQGRLFPLPEVDEDDEEPVLFESEQIWFSKNPDGHYVIASLDGSIALRFAPLVVAEDGSDEDATLFPLVAVEDANGNHQRFVYHAGRSAAIRHRRQRLGVLTGLRQCGGRAISLRRQQRVDQPGVC